ncbi:MAG: restriction endonuclease [Thermoplasmatota archaeon]
MAGPESAIPVGTQFSPDLVDLREFLRACIRHGGDKPAMERAVWQAPVRIAPVRAPPTRRRASLPLEAARQYGLLDAAYQPTDLARKLADLASDRMYSEFARHILLNLRGLRVVEAAQQMAMDEPLTGTRITGDTLAAYLTAQGFRVTIHNTAINSLRMWLAKAGVFRDGWAVDGGAKAVLLGLNDKDIAALVQLNEQERAFLLALCRLNPTGPIAASRVREMAENIIGIGYIDRSSLPKLMRPLEEAGLVRVRSGGTRSGKTATVETTEKFSSEVLQPFVERTVKDMDAVVTDYYNRAIPEILTQLDANDSDTKGRALEAYAIQVMRLLGLRFVKWRLRAGDSRSAEVDVVMAGVMGGVPTRWQVQCKNQTVAMSVEDVAKEVGLVPLTKATHILIISRGGYTKPALAYARDVMRQSQVSLFLLDSDDFESIRSSRGAALAGIIRRKSEEIGSLPRVGLETLGG